MHISLVNTALAFLLQSAQRTLTLPPTCSGTLWVFSAIVIGWVLSLAFFHVGWLPEILQCCGHFVAVFKGLLSVQCIQPDQMFFLKKLLALILFSPQILSSRTPFSGLRWWKLFHLFDSDLLHKPDSICAFFGKSYPQLSGTFPLAGYLEAAGSLCMAGSPSKDSKILSVMFRTAHIPAVLEKSSKYYFFTDKNK